MDPALVARLGRLGGWPPGDDDAAVGRRQLSLTASWALVALHWHALLLGLWVGLLLGALPSGAVFGPGAWILPGWAAALLLAHGIWLRQLRRGPHRLLGLPWRMTTLVLMGTLVGTLVGAPSPVPAAWLHGLGGLDLVLAAAPCSHGQALRSGVGTGRTPRCVLRRRLVPVMRSWCSLPGCWMPRSRSTALLRCRCWA